jgi:hypothetical protein
VLGVEWRSHSDNNVTKQSELLTRWMIAVRDGVEFELGRTIIRPSTKRLRVEICICTRTRE